MAIADATERYAAMQLIASNSSLKKELVQPNPSRSRIESYLDRVGIESPFVRAAIEAIRVRPQSDRDKIADVANLLHSAFFNHYPDVCPPDGYAPSLVSAWKNLDSARNSYPEGK